MTSFTVRLTPSLKAAAAERAAHLGISLNALIAVSLDSYLRGLEAQKMASPLPPPSVCLNPPEKTVSVPAKGISEPKEPTQESPPLSRQQRRALERKEAKKLKALRAKANF